MLSAAFCDQIAYDPFAQYHNSLLYKHLVIVIIWLTLSFSLSPKEITLMLGNLTQ